MTTIYTTAEGSNMTAPTFNALTTPGGFIGDGTKITLNNPTYVVITNSSNQLTTSQYLPPTMGGFGLNPTSATGVIASNGTSLVYVPYSNLATAGTLTLRDGSGGITATTITASTQITTPTLTASTQITTPILTISNYISTPSIVLPINSMSNIYLLGSYMQTTNANTVILATINTVSTATVGQKGTTYLITCEISLGDSTAELNTGSYVFSFKAKNINGTTTVSQPLNTESMLDGALIGTLFTITTSGTNILINVIGLSGVTINWSGCYRIIATVF